MVIECVDLLTAVDVLDHFAGDIFGEILETRETRTTRRQSERMSVVKIRAMLRAMAAECLLKALWLKHGGRLAEGGRYTRVLKREHDLHKLAKKVSEKGHIDFTQRELDLLEQASYWITSGRYPIQKDFSHSVRSEDPMEPWRLVSTGEATRLRH